MEITESRKPALTSLRDLHCISYIAIAVSGRLGISFHSVSRRNTLSAGVLQRRLRGGAICLSRSYDSRFPARSVDNL